MQHIGLNEDEQLARHKKSPAYIILHLTGTGSSAKRPEVFVAREGYYLQEADGTRYLDTSASLLTTICGCNHPEIARAASLLNITREQIGEIAGLMAAAIKAATECFGFGTSFAAGTDYRLPVLSGGSPPSLWSVTCESC